MKNLLKIITLLILTFSTLWILSVNAGLDLESVPWFEKNIKDHSIVSIESTWVISEDVKTLWFSALTIIKYIVSWLLVIVLVYVGIQMIMSMWSNEEELSSSKKQLRYTLVWLIFINIPWSLYKIFEKNSTKSISWSIGWTWTNSEAGSVLINTASFDQTINSWIIVFVQIALAAIAILIIIIAGIRIIISRWREDQITESKNKITWSLIWLMFIWFIEAWKIVVYKWNITDWVNLFKTMEELALFFAWPVAIIFLTLAGYYYITANGDEEKVKKSKSIIINTLIAVVIIIASHAFLKDLLTL